MSKQELETLDDELQRSILELNSKFDEKCSTLKCKIKELNSITDELASIHKGTTVGSLSGTVVGIATTAVGLLLAPFTFGVSLAVSAAGVAATATGTACSITNMIKQKNLRQTIMKITEDFQNIINPIIEHLKAIYNIIKEIQKKKKWVSESDMTLGWTLSITVGTLETLLGISSFAIELRMAKLQDVATRTARALRMAGKITGALSLLFLPFDIYGIVQDSKEIAEMNQVADKSKAEEIQSNTLKFIHQVRETSTLFQESLDEIENARDAINRGQCVQCGGMHL